MNIPESGTRWRHNNGIEYVVVGMANELDTPKYPLTVVYVNPLNKKLYTRVMTDWHRSFQPV